MKKPNITEGPWHMIEGSNEDWRDIYATDAPVNSGDIICQDVDKRNAKSIRAVPEMIDELIDVYLWMLQLKTSHPHLVSDEEIESIESTLEKAGAEI